MNHDALRRAAILITTLDTASADALLNEMSSEQAASIRNAIMELGEVDIVEQQEIMEQFVGRSEPTHTVTDDSVELDDSLVQQFAAGPRPAEETGFANQIPVDKAQSTATDECEPFAFLEFVAPSELARVLTNEHPQTLAIVVAHLSSDRAAEVIANLPREQQSDALIRVARLTPPHPDVIRDLEREIQALLADHRVLEQVAPEGLAKVEAILRQASAETRLNMVADLSRQDHALARQLNSKGEHPRAPTSCPSPAQANSQLPQTTGSNGGCTHAEPQDSSLPNLEFADLEHFDESSLAQVLRHCSPNTTLLALAGASHQFVQRIVSQLPDREATQLQRKIQNIGPIRLDDVQRAQQIVARTAASLIKAGTLQLPDTQRLYVAA